MPLPDNVSISLHNQPTDPVSKPKHAVLVRLSPEALEALGDPNHPRMDFQFGDEPGIYIGDQFFPIKRQTDDVRHELFLRAATATRPNPPLKHYATITGKLEVTRRLGPKLTDQLRKTRIEAAEQHSNRRTILIDNPPDLSNVPARKKKEHASMFRKPARPPDNPVTRTAPVPSTSSTTSSTTAPTKDGVVPLRTRLVHYIALNEPTSEEVVRVVGGRRGEILECLDQLAEQIPPPGKKTTDKMDTSEYKWRLRPSSWLQVRPYEWPSLKETERTSMARSARSACSTLKIPESDPVWHHFRFRNPSSTTPAPANDSSKGSTVPEGSNAAKRGVSSKEVKKKPKVPKAEMQIKDETRPPPPRPSATATPSSISSSAPRKPGSGYKLSRTPSQDMTPDTVTKTKTKTTTDPRLGGAARYTPVSEEKRKEKASDAERIRTEATDSDREAAKRRERALEKERFRPVDADSDREVKRHLGKERSSKGVEISTKGKERDSSGALKRKKVPPPEDDDAPSTSSSVQLKKRKMEQEPTHPSRHSLPQKPTLDLAAHTKTMKKEPSPLPPRPSQQKNPSTSKGNGTVKARRRSPVFTSSDEDDGQRQVAPLPTPPTTTPSSLSSQTTSRSVLRAKYRKKYVEQLDSYRDVCELKRRIEEILDNNNSSGTITESEGDIDTWDVNAVAKRYAGVREEMQTIRQVFEKR